MLLAICISSPKDQQLFQTSHVYFRMQSPIVEVAGIFAVLFVLFYMLHEFLLSDCFKLYPGGCQHEITSAVGEVSSPEWPDHYPGRKDCVWHFVTTPGHRIKLVFNDFELEPHHQCNYDHVEIFDGSSAESKSLGKFCGSNVPEPLLASGNEMYMSFFSDASVQRKGFHATHTTG